MLNIEDALQVFVFSQAVDMRKSFDSLESLVSASLKISVFKSSAVFVFFSRGKERVKLLYWDADGYALWYKRLEAGTFRFKFSEQGTEELNGVDLKLLLSGVDFARIKIRKKYQISTAK